MTDDVTEYANDVDKMHQQLEDEGREAESERSFSHFIANLESGRFNAELSKEMQKLANKMMKHNSLTQRATNGKIALSISLSCTNDGIFDIVADYKITPPKEKRARSVAFCDHNGNLVSDDPRQMSMYGKGKHVLVEKSGKGRNFYDK